MLHPKIKFGCSTLGAPARLAEHPRPQKGLNGYESANIILTYSCQVIRRHLLWRK